MIAHGTLTLIEHQVRQAYDWKAKRTLTPKETHHLILTSCPDHVSILRPTYLGLVCAHYGRTTIILAPASI